jgi:hypothetical protein
MLCLKCNSDDCLLVSKEARPDHSFLCTYICQTCGSRFSKVLDNKENGYLKRFVKLDGVWIKQHRATINDSWETYED